MRQDWGFALRGILWALAVHNRDDGHWQLNAGNLRAAAEQPPLDVELYLVDRGAKTVL